MKSFIKTIKSASEYLLLTSFMVFASFYHTNKDITDVNGKRYKTIKIGEQEWMAENLNVNNFCNGDPVPEVNSRSEWNIAGRQAEPAMCYLDNEDKNGEKYGRLYNWYAVNDPRGLCPEGWRLPSDKDWRELIDYLGGEKTAGEKMKSVIGWEDNNNGTNETGFSGLPGGYRQYRGNFNNQDASGGYWWGSTEGFLNIPNSPHSLYYSRGGGYRYYSSKGRGFSVRCIKDR